MHAVDSFMRRNDVCPHPCSSMYAFRCPLGSVNWAGHQYCDHLHGKGGLVDKQVVETGCGVVLTRQLLYMLLQPHWRMRQSSLQMTCDFQSQKQCSLYPSSPAVQDNKSTGLAEVYQMFGKSSH